MTTTPAHRDLMHRCHSCGRGVPAALRFCPVCGADLRARPVPDAAVPMPSVAEEQESRVMLLTPAPVPARPARWKKWLPARRLAGIIAGVVLAILLVVGGLIIVSLLLKERERPAMNAVGQAVVPAPATATATEIDVAAARTADARLMATLTAVALAKATPTATPLPSPTATMTPAVMPSPSPASPAMVTSAPSLTVTVIPSYTTTVSLKPTLILSPIKTPTSSVALTPPPTPVTAVSPQAPVPRAYVNVPGLIVHSGPDTKSGILGTVKKGDQLYIMGKNLAGTWLLVCCLADRQPGWVFAEYVNIVGDLEVVPIVPER